MRDISNRNLPEGMSKMREKAINEARRMKSKSQSSKNLSKEDYKNEGKNHSESGEIIEVKEEAAKMIVKSSRQNTKSPPKMKGISSIVSRFLSDSDSTLIIILILLLMDEEENFLILLVLLYLLM